MRTLLAAAALLIAPPALADEAVEPNPAPLQRGQQPMAPSLHEPIRASGPALRLGDVFRIDGPAADREIAPAPPRGQSAFYATSFLAAAAQAAGYAWSPPPGLTQVLVEGLGASGVTYDPAPTRSSSSGTGIRRGDLVTLTYEIGPLRLSTRAKATASAAQGEAIRLVNLDSERVIDAVVTGPGQATVSPQ